MSRRTLAALAFGWLLGIVTAMVIPGLVWQRQTIGIERQINGQPQYRALMEDGWYLVRTEDEYRLVTLERLRLRIP